MGIAVLPPTPIVHATSLSRPLLVVIVAAAAGPLDKLAVLVGAEGGVVGAEGADFEGSVVPRNVPPIHTFSPVAVVLI